MNTRPDSPDLDPEDSAPSTSSSDASAKEPGDETTQPETASGDSTAPEPGSSEEQKEDATSDAASAQPEETAAEASAQPEETAAEASPQPEETTAEASPPDDAATKDPDPAPEAEVESEATSVSAEPAEVTMAAATPPATDDASGSEDSTTGDDAAAKKEVAEAVAADTRLEHQLKKGQRVEVKLVQAGEKDTFLDWGGPSEGTIATAELKDQEGNLRVKEGDSFTAIVRETGDTVVFTVGRGKGGFEVDLGGVRAFCPFSQIDTIYCENPEVHVGREYPFEIITFERGGRNIVVSRRGLLEAEQKEKAVATREALEVGQVLPGVVRRIQPYGAFVDIGGLDGLVHVSEISQAHVRNPKDVLSVGQEVEVKVVGLDALGTKKERVSLSMKALAPDPWSGAADKWKVGTTAQGKVVRLTDFGAFVELAPGVDGLVHVSQISSERIGHPNEVLKPGQEVEVRILDLDVDAHRISLSMRPEGEDAPRGGGMRGGGRRGAPRERAPMEYVSEPEETKDDAVDVSDMEYDDAVAALKKKFEQ